MRTTSASFIQGRRSLFIVDGTCWELEILFETKSLFPYSLPERRVDIMENPVPGIDSDTAGGIPA